MLSDSMSLHQEQVTSKLLQPHQMLTLLKRGLSDKPPVADACRFMLCACWLKEENYDPIELLKRVDVLQVEVGNKKKGDDCRCPRPKYIFIICLLLGEMLRNLFRR